MAVKKTFDLPFGERDKSQVTPALEALKQVEADRAIKRMQREDEKEQLEHEAEIEKKRTEAEEARRQREREPITEIILKKVAEGIDPDIARKQAESEIARLRQEAKEAAEIAERTKEELAIERQKRLENSFADLAKEIREIKSGHGRGRSLTEVIDEAVETAEKLGYAKGGTPEISPELQLEIKKLDYNLQMELERMRDERDKRDKEWQLTLKKWEEEKEMRRQELQQKVEAEERRMQFLSHAQERIGRVIAGVVTSKGGGVSAGSMASAVGKSFHVEAGEGEEGEVACPKCNENIFIPPDADKAVCSSCGMSIDILRTSKEVKKEEDLETVKAEAQSQTKSKGKQD